MLQYALGEVGISPAHFWGLTFAEFHHAATAHRIAIERQWEQTRYLAAILININVKKKDQVTPEKLVPLSFDRERVKEFKPLSPEQLEMLKNWK